MFNVCALALSCLGGYKGNSSLKTFPWSQNAADAEYKINVGFSTLASKEIFSEVLYREIIRVIVAEKPFGEKEVKLSVQKQGCREALMGELWEGGRITYSAAAVYVWSRNTPRICFFT